MLLTLPWELPALPCLIPVSKLSKKLVLVSGIEFPTELVTKICSHGFLAWLGEVSVSPSTLWAAGLEWCWGCLGSLWQKVLCGEEEVQQETGEAKQSHHQHKTLKGKGGTQLGFCWF